MAHPYHHALASVKKWGGEVSDYLPLHSWFDQSKAIAGDFRHRALRHHAEGIFLLETIYGPTITLSTGRVIPTRYVGEQHVQQDLGFIPSFADWMRAIRPLPWMGRAGRLDDRPARAKAEPAENGERHDRSRSPKPAPTARITSERSTGKREPGGKRERPTWFPRVRHPAGPGTGSLLPEAPPCAQLSSTPKTARSPQLRSTVHSNPCSAS